jgi:hypothetical protein
MSEVTGIASIIFAHISEVYKGIHGLQGGICQL